VYIINTKDKTYGTTESMEIKASETTTIVKEPLTSHAHHVKIQNKYNTNLNVYSIFSFFCIAK
jgi:hypothetical protein